MNHSSPGRSRRNTALSIGEYRNFESAIFDRQTRKRQSPNRQSKNRESGGSGIDDRESTTGNRRSGIDDRESQKLQSKSPALVARNAIARSGIDKNRVNHSAPTGRTHAVPTLVTPQELRERMAAFAAAVARFAKPLFRDDDTRDAAAQVTRSAASAMANHRSAGRARSHAEFTSKLAIAVEEVDESQGWLKYLEDSDSVPAAAKVEHQRLYLESTELTAILTASLSTARRKEVAERNRRLRPARR